MSDFTVSTQQQVANFFGRGISTIKTWQAAGMPGEHGSYDLAAIVQWLRERGPWRPKVTDPLLAADGDSPGLERYRQAKAALAELELEERKGRLVDTAKHRDMLGRWAVILRRCGERLSKRFGNAAAEIFNAAIDECEAAIDAPEAVEQP